VSFTQILRVRIIVKSVSFYSYLWFNCNKSEEKSPRLSEPMKESRKHFISARKKTPGILVDGQKKEGQVKSKPGYVLIMLVLAPALAKTHIRLYSNGSSGNIDMQLYSSAVASARAGGDAKEQTHLYLEKFCVKTCNHRSHQSQRRHRTGGRIKPGGFLNIQPCLIAF
jgi:hypothetical protein